MPPHSIPFACRSSARIFFWFSCALLVVLRKGGELRVIPLCHFYLAKQKGINLFASQVQLSSFKSGRFEAEPNLKSRTRDTNSPNCHLVLQAMLLPTLHLYCVLVTRTAVLHSQHVPISFQGIDSRIQSAHIHSAEIISGKETHFSL